MDDERPWKAVTCRPIKRSKVVPLILRCSGSSPHTSTPDSPGPTLAPNTVQLEARFLNEPLTGIQYYFRYLSARVPWGVDGAPLGRALESCGYTTANYADKIE
ncbi:unnamed protein product [Vitrella brassicaformis CCMP3155]|uniref:Uncharacterized protein n=1 Tax=Vitrella brassicaformis (strain CCMP3155) TaxID=1169540 RepID=A0A0G4FU57_VITBC|nr:unnamed protein product [Vitrella brassicaformis CCMP3155]|eukprot:CEM17833.1 unnamed protein product [Vitrella brassicaformis CCMP3155]